MPEDKFSDAPMILVLAELKSINRTLKLLAAHLMDQEAPPTRAAVDGTIPFMSDELPKRLPEPVVQRLHAMEPRRRDYLLGELRRAWEDP
jgi:hypothetical protein